MPVASSFHASATVTVAVYGLIGGAWTFLGRNACWMNQWSSTGGQKQLSGNYQFSVSSSANITDFRVLVESVDADSGGITNAPTASWTAQTSSGSRSATPNGEAVTATVRPN